MTASSFVIACVTDTHTDCLTDSDLTHSLTHRPYSLPHSLVHSLTHCLTHSLTLFLPASCGRQCPKEEKVKAIATKEGWLTNVPSFTDVLQAWVSPLKTAIEENEDIMKSVVEQKWRGIALKDFGEPKGKGEERQKSTTFL